MIDTCKISAIKKKKKLCDKSSNLSLVKHVIHQNIGNNFDICDISLVLHKKHFLVKKLTKIVF